MVSHAMAAGKFLFVVDNPTADIVWNSEAGMKTAWVSRGRNWAVNDSKPDVVIASVGDLVRMFSA
ncbi:MAG: HAD hydrolase-like protein [Chloroflexi bacterium]|nr:HAD hydrolase-like protein [Chloroflexota bacterium]MBT7003686.1 HAD hydrolase-like protein [Chloroflexota bacterium]MBT7466985.1 HAD hydrolase-like protein [Chloroflexota bacterium]